MGPDFWTAFVFFGIPLVVGLVFVAGGGLLTAHSARWLVRILT